MSTPLIVYKASAGSGKTFTLAAEYIKHVVRNPQAYKKILAVTFTNKATEEMKMRILSQLYGISRQLHSSKDYTDLVCKKLDASPAFVAQQAGIALRNILHDYNNFHIDTIDSFFQHILRNLARELELTANLRVGLNDIDVEELAVDELIENLSTTDKILSWILKYIMDRIDDDHSWNVIGQVKMFGRTIFKDFYKSNRNQLKEAFDKPDFFEHYTKELQIIKANAKEHMQAYSKAFFEALHQGGFEVEDLSYGKSGIARFFLKINEGCFDESITSARVTACIDAPEKWHKKKYEREEQLEALVRDQLNDILKKAYNDRANQWKLYQSADITLTHLSQLRLLESIELKVRELNATANRFLLSDTQQLLHELIADNDSSFIFEKTGTQIEYIMIDEFQDTSTIQWKNFLLLLRESMSHAGSENLIVGDVKQSIYRWRSGDWRLLANIEKEFPQPGQIDVIPLKTNYRSSKRVIYFNNHFFEQAAMIEEVDAYSDVEQKVPEKRPDKGFVNITLLTADDYQEHVLSMLKKKISTMISSGIPFSDIAILVRSNKLIPLIANYFMEQMPEIPIVSDEAFRLDASPAIQMIIQALRVLIRPDDDIAKAYLAKLYTKSALLHERNIDEMLPKDLTERREAFRLFSLYELTERLYEVLHLQEIEGQDAYLCAFYDVVADFVKEQTTDIRSFLKEWDETLCGKTIQNAELKGIRILSIHKSKGLEFPHVLIPFCDWRMEHSDILWCNPTEQPFNKLPIVPVDYYQKKLQGTIYENDYNEEHRQITVDNLNLLYVAFTRASESLQVIGRKGATGSRSVLIEQVLPLVVGKLEGATLEGTESDKTDIVFEYGSQNVASEEQDESEESDKKKNVFLQEAVPIPLNISTYSSKVEFKQSNDSRNFVMTEDNEIQQAAYIQLGSILHNVFSSIRTTTDIDKALQQLELEGIIYNKHLTREKIDNLIRERISHPRVADWYSGRWTLFNECSILNIDPKTRKVYERRPDRVMTDGNEMIVVDFKFGKPNDDYKEQVNEYMSLLASMGYKNIRGYIWYVYTNKIVEVA